jgi:ADP-ribose pyrophosphatase
MTVRYRPALTKRGIKVSAVWTTTRLSWTRAQARSVNDYRGGDLVPARFPGAAGRARCKSSRPMPEETRTVERSRGEGQVVFRGRAVTVRVDPIWARSGPSTREVVERQPAVAILPEDGQERIVVIRQFRWAVSRWLWELPAGLVEVDESEEAAARRELEEETGFRAGQLRRVHQYFPSPGYSTERLTLFYATDLTAGVQQLDPDEDISWERWDRNTVLQHLVDQDIDNGITLLGLYWWLLYKKALAR